MGRFSKWFVPGLVLALIMHAESTVLSGVGGDTSEPAPTAKQVVKEWAYPGSCSYWVTSENGPIQVTRMQVEVEDTYDQTIARIDKFYSQKCGSTRNHAEPNEIMPFDRSETKKGGKSVIDTFHIFHKDILYIHATDHYTINVFARPDRKDHQIELILSVTVR